MNSLLGLHTSKLRFLYRSVLPQSQKRNASISKTKKCGLVGLPNVGKSSLFNAFVGREAAQSANYPFCTIDPNHAYVEVPDERLRVLRNIAKSTRLVPTQIEFVDIAGLVKGASEGKGLGNQFLSNISSVSSIIHVVRCFDDPTITHVENRLDPLEDIDIIENELLRKDIQFMESHSRKPPKKMALDINTFKKVCNTTKELLESGKKGVDIRNMFSYEQQELFDSFKLLSSKPMIICCNVNEEDLKGNDMTKRVMEWAEKNNRINPIVVGVKLESEIVLFEEDPAKRSEVYQQYGLEESVLGSVIKTSYDALGLITFYTVGEQEARAWSFPKGYSARECASLIHTDIANGFIKAETFSYDDYVATKGHKSKMRLEGPQYAPVDGDVLMFRFKK